MAKHEFLLTYSVHCLRDSAEGKAAKIRQHIRVSNETDWQVYAGIETSITGQISFTPFQTTIKEKQEAAVQRISGKLKTIKTDCEAGSSEIEIRCLMMVQGAGQAFSFSV